MGLINLFKKSVTIEDNVFGSLRYVGFKDATKNYFEGRGFFEPTHSEIEFLIQADSDGPTEEQKQFYLDLQSDFGKYIEKITELIEDEFYNWREDFKIIDFNKEFTLVCITIPRQDIHPMIWDMSFTTIHEPNHQITIDFIDKDPNGVMIDG